MPDHGEGEEEESLRFLFAVEYLDSSVVPPPEAVAYESGVELLKSMYVGHPGICDTLRWYPFEPSGMRLLGCTCAGA